MSISFKLPEWFDRLVPKRTKDDLEQRAKITGTAMQTRSYSFGPIEIEVQTGYEAKP